MIKCQYIGSIVILRNNGKVITVRQLIVLEAAGERLAVFRSVRYRLYRMRHCAVRYAIVLEASV